MCDLSATTENKKKSMQTFHNTGKIITAGVVAAVVVVFWCKDHFSSSAPNVLYMFFYCNIMAFILTSTSPQLRNSNGLDDYYILYDDEDISMINAIIFGTPSSMISVELPANYKVKMEEVGSCDVLGFREKVDEIELEEFNKRVEDFIAKFNRQMRLERQQSLARYHQNLTAENYVQAV
ncbi:hypothetical protein SUGI_1187180 [Cryptomeria japonica]|nr:hypothetical protein SUGI_1187180 [Cryptomeria japonica]